MQSVHTPSNDRFIQRIKQDSAAADYTDNIQCDAFLKKRIITQMITI